MRRTDYVSIIVRCQRDFTESPLPSKEKFSYRCLHSFSIEQLKGIVLAYYTLDPVKVTCVADDVLTVELVSVQHRLREIRKDLEFRHWDWL